MKGENEIETPHRGGASEHRSVELGTEGRGAKLGQLEELHTEGHTDNGAGECNPRNKEAHRQRNADQKQPKEISDWLSVEVDVHSRSARPGRQVRDAEAGKPRRDEDNGEAAKDPYQEKDDRERKTVNTKPKDVDDRIHCENLSCRVGARTRHAIIHIKFIIE